MRESTIEKHLVKLVKGLGWGCFKLNGPGDRGKPDRMVMMSGGRVVFVEVKAPGKKLSKLQSHWFEFLEARGFDCWMVDSKDAVDELVERLKR